MPGLVEQYAKIAAGLSPESILQQAKNKIIKGASHKNRNFSKLEAYLNSVFYGNNGTNKSITASLQNAAAEYYGNIIGQKFDSYDFEKNFFSSVGSANGKIALDERASFSHSKYIARNTVLKRLWEAEHQLNNLMNSSDPNGEYENIISDLQKLINTANTLYGELPFITLSNGVNVIKVDENSRNLINQLDELYQKVSFAASLPLTVQELGDVFEKALSAVGDADTVDNLTDEVIKENFSKSTLGHQTSARGGLIQLSGVDFEIKENKNKKTGQSSIRYEVAGDNGSVINISGEFSDKQGKMDVLFTMPETHEQFRVSAKNWKTIDSSRGFGQTDLEGAVIRTGGFVNTIAYGIGVGIVNSPLQNAHDYAKACAILDIVMGYSQDSAYADTLIINDRSSASIKVFSIEAILDKINYNSVLGYPNNIRNDIRSNFNLSKHLNLQQYENKILSTMKKYKLTINSSLVGS